MDWSVDGGRSWMRADGRAFWAVAFGGDGVGWAVGPEGRIVEIRVRSPSAGQAASERSVSRR